MKNNNWLFFSLAGLTCLVGIFCFFDLAYGENSSGAIDVGMTVGEGEGDGGGAGGEVPVNNPPQISNVSSTASYYSAIVSWSATDDGGIVGTDFNYGLTTGYGTSVTATGTYFATLTGLAPSSTYYYKITVYDGGGLSAFYEGSFITSPATRVKSLKIIAKPEKRVAKTGGNLALTGSLIIYNPATAQTLSVTQVSLSDSGSSTYSNIEIGTGSGLHLILKGRSHLAKRITGVDILAGTDVVLDFTNGGTVELYAGDVQGTGLKDNLVDILDVAMTDTQFNTANVDADLNRDGAVDVLDMSIVLVNYGRAGDIIPTG